MQTITIAQCPELESFMGQQITAELLKFAAGQHIFCPGCQNVLDWQQIVTIDFKGVNTGKLHAVQVLCCLCADKLLPGIESRLTGAQKKAGERLKLHVTDGRDWNEEEEYDPAPELKLSGPVRLLAARPDKATEAVDAFRVDSGLQDWAHWFLYQMPGGRWFVCEMTTGYAASSGNTAKEAAVAAFRRLRQVGKAKFYSVCAKLPTLNP